MRTPVNFACKRTNFADVGEGVNMAKFCGRPLWMASKLLICNSGPKSPNIALRVKMHPREVTTFRHIY